MMEKCILCFCLCYAVVSNATACSIQVKDTRNFEFKEHEKGNISFHVKIIDCHKVNITSALSDGSSKVLKLSRRNDSTYIDQCNLFISNPQRNDSCTCDYHTDGGREKKGNQRLTCTLSKTMEREDSTGWMIWGLGSLNATFNVTVIASDEPSTYTSDADAETTAAADAPAVPEGEWQSATSAAPGQISATTLTAPAKPSASKAGEAQTADGTKRMKYQESDVQTDISTSKMTLEFGHLVFGGVIAVVVVVIVILSVLVAVLFKKLGAGGINYAATVGSPAPRAHNFRPDLEGLALILRQLQQPQAEPEPPVEMRQMEVDLRVDHPPRPHQPRFADNTYEEIPGESSRGQGRVCEVQMDNRSSVWLEGSTDNCLHVSNNSSPSSSSSSSSSAQSNSATRSRLSFSWSDRSSPKVHPLPDDYLHPVAPVAGVTSTQTDATADATATSLSIDDHPYQNV